MRRSLKDRKGDGEFVTYGWALKTAILIFLNEKLD